MTTTDVKETTPFTVRWEYDLGGISKQRLIDTDQVHVAYDQRAPVGGEREPTKLGIYNVYRTGVVVLGNPYDGAESMCLAFGTVFVMNRDGKTVAKYHLGPVPGTEQGSQESAGRSPSRALRNAELDEASHKARVPEQHRAI